MESLFIEGMHFLKYCVLPVSEIQTTSGPIAMRRQILFGGTIIFVCDKSCFVESQMKDNTAIGNTEN